MRYYRTQYSLGGSVFKSRGLFHEGGKDVFVTAGLVPIGAEAGI